MAVPSHLTALFFLLLVSVLGPVLALRLKLPTAIVLILVGIAAGPGGLGLLEDTPHVALLSELGFLILMFLAGMEIDFESLRTAGLRLISLPTLTVVGFGILAVVIGIQRHLSLLDVLVVSASSVGMPLAVLQETGHTQKPLGRYVMLTASIGEFVSILAVTGFELFAEEATVSHRIVKVIKVLLLFAVSAVLIRWARAVVWWRPDPFRRLIRHHDVAELGVRTGLLVMIAFVIISATLGVEAILGAFIAGALVAFVLREKSVLESKLSALGHGLFIPIFFTVVGVRFDPRLVDLATIGNAGVFVLIVVSIKVLPSLVFAPRILGLRERLAAGALLSAPLTLVVAIATIGRRLGAIDAAREATFVLLAIVLSIVFPILFRFLAPSRQNA